MGIRVFDACVAFVISLVSGYLGIGGGILMAPVLLYLPPPLGMARLSMHEVTGLTMAQALVACMSGAWTHGRKGYLDRRLVGWVGAGLLPASLAGSLLSHLIPGRALQGVLAVLSLVAALLVSRSSSEDDPQAAAPLTLRLPLAIALGAGVGFVCGMLGQGGSFILIPSMISLLRVPTRVAMGSNLGLVLLSSSAGFVGKVATGQVTPLLTLVVALGAVPGAVIGSRWSHRTRPCHLRFALGALVACVGVALGIGALRGA